MHLRMQVSVLLFGGRWDLDFTGRDEASMVGMGTPAFNKSRCTLYISICPDTQEVPG